MARDFESYAVLRAETSEAIAGGTPVATSDDPNWTIYVIDTHGEPSDGVWYFAVSVRDLFGHEALSNVIRVHAEPPGFRGAATQSKTGDAFGRYMHPEARGLSETMDEHYSDEFERMKAGYKVSSTDKKAREADRRALARAEAATGNWRR